MLHGRFGQIFGVIHQEQPATSQHKIIWSILGHHKMRVAKACRPSWVLRSKISISEINKKKQKPPSISYPLPAIFLRQRQLPSITPSSMMCCVPEGCLWFQVYSLKSLGVQRKFGCRINLWSLGAVAQHVRHLHDNPNVPLWLLPNLSNRFAQKESENVHKSDAIGKLHLQKVSECPKMSHQKEQIRNHK